MTISTHSLLFPGGAGGGCIFDLPGMGGTVFSKISKPFNDDEYLMTL